jgi:nicotinic acid mononucleotide adenylyltransferase
MLDEYFQSLYNINPDMRFLAESGYVDDGGWKQEFNLDSNAPSTDRLKANAGDEKEVSVLIYPGCFAPIHEGHLEAMNIARRTVEEQTGEKVVAGFFAPDNDDYVQRKTNDLRFTDVKRIAIVKDLVKDNNWMEVDEWCALYASKALNFTTLYERLNQYLAIKLPELKVKLYIVFGEDNILFGNAFIGKGFGVCVKRDGVTSDSTKLIENKNILFSTEVPPAVSSTMVRKRFSEDTPYILNGSLNLASV